MGEKYILCVDDEVIITISLKRELQLAFPQYHIEAANSGKAALDLLSDLLADGGELVVIVTDERMPGMSGHTLLREIRAQSPNTYGILLTGYSDVDAIAEAVNEAGLFRYMHKPWERRDLAMAITRATELYERERELADLRSRIEKLNIAVVAALENSAHEDDPNTYGHVQRVAVYASIIARGLGLPESEVHKIYLYAPLHDIGKSGIPHDILSKPARLTPEEFEKIKEHVAIGGRILKSIDVDPVAKDLILYHHERWDGHGYLSELSGEAIPLAARIVALADVLDAMLSDRPYKAAIPFDDVVAEISADSGARFDPKVIEVFMAHLEDFRHVATHGPEAERPKQ